MKKKIRSVTFQNKLGKQSLEKNEEILRMFFILIGVTERQFNVMLVNSILFQQGCDFSGSIGLAPASHSTHYCEYYSNDMQKYMLPNNSQYLLLSPTLYSKHKSIFHRVMYINMQYTTNVVFDLQSAKSEWKGSPLWRSVDTSCIEFKRKSLNKE